MKLSNYPNENSAETKLGVIFSMQIKLKDNTPWINILSVLHFI